MMEKYLDLKQRNKVANDDEPPKKKQKVACQYKEEYLQMEFSRTGDQVTLTIGVLYVAKFWLTKQ